MTEMKICPMNVLGPGTICWNGIPRTWMASSFPPADGVDPIYCRGWKDPVVYDTQYGGFTNPAHCVFCESRKIGGD